MKAGIETSIHVILTLISAKYYEEIHLRKYFFYVLVSYSVYLELQSFCPGKKVDYSSKVAHYTFANILQEQESQLKINPLMLRLAESRKKLSLDKFRPIYHFVNLKET